MFPVSLLSYFPKNSILLHIYTSILKPPIPVCTISYFSEYMKAIQELLYLSINKLLALISLPMFFCAVTTEDALLLPSENHPCTSNLDSITSVLKDSPSVFLPPCIKNFSFSTELFLSIYKHAQESPTFFSFLSPSLLHVPF